MKNNNTRPRLNETNAEAYERVKCGVGFLNTIDDCYLFQCVNQPTYHNNILDLVLTDNEQRIHDLNFLAPIGSMTRNRLHATLIWKFSFHQAMLTQTIQSGSGSMKLASIVLFPRRP